MIKFLASVASTMNKTQTHMLTTLAFGGDTAASICGAMAQVRCTHTHTHTHTVTIGNDRKCEKCTCVLITLFTYHEISTLMKPQPYAAHQLIPLRVVHGQSEEGVSQLPAAAVTPRVHRASGCNKAFITRIYTWTGDA